MDILQHNSSLFVKHNSSRAQCKGATIAAESVVEANITMRFGQRLRKMRNAQGLTQEQLGFAVGVTNSAISAWESERDFPSFTALVALREVLKCSLDELVCGAAASTDAIPTDGRALWPVPPANLARDPAEETLLARFRAMTHAKRAAVLELLKPSMPRKPIATPRLVNE